MSVMSGEVIAFSDMFDIDIALSLQMSKIMSRHIPVQLFTDNKSLFDGISKGSRASEKRTMLHIPAAREGFRDNLTSDIGFVRSNSNIADGLTNPMNQAALRNVLNNEFIEVRPEQWIVPSAEIAGLLPFH